MAVQWKYRKVALLLLPICAAIVGASLAFGAMAAAGIGSDRALDPGTDKLDPALQEALSELAPDHILDYIVYLEPAIDLNDGATVPRGPERAASLVSLLQESAAEAQAPLLSTLETMRREGEIATYRPLWIVNAFLVSGTARSIYQVAGRPEVARVALDKRLRLLEPIRSAESLVAVQATAWGVERVRAPHAWHGLDIDGAGVTIAVMDSGVDWTHPALASSYRGSSGGGNPGHSGNWYDAVAGAAEPNDPNGHGTHVAGTAVGAGGIGVAPGANWIAARVLDAEGFGTVGAIHLAFQWLLAPADDPSLSPDVVTASWGGSESLLDFLPDVAALKAAGIIPIFSAGNFGPFPGSLTAPAAYPGALAIGASAPDDTVAWFSSRGPSGLTDETKPVFVAPGTSILSSLPGAAYGTFNGTSMAVPHAAGVYALLLSERPELLEVELTAIITATAVVLTGVSPHDAGWGRLDAYAALATVAEAGTLRGHLVAGGQPLSGALLTVTTPSGAEIPFLSNAAGTFEIQLHPGRYDLAVNHFGFEAYAAYALSVEMDAVTEHPIDLALLPHGRVSGTLYDLATGLPVTGTVRANPSPIESMTDELGRFSLELPAGDYELVASSREHRLGRVNIHLTAGADLLQDFTLESGPQVLLVDSGGWYFRSQAAYFAAALEDAGYFFDLWSIANPFSDVPAAGDLAAYDTVVWSSPLDSPGEIFAGDALYAYLADGGNLLISGQDVGELDDRAQIVQQWWHNQLRGEYLSPHQPPFDFSGEPGSVFDGIELSLNGPDSADNQDSPDRVRPAPGSQARVALRHPDGSPAALLAGQCAPFRIAYFGFGLEGVNGSPDRSKLIEASFEHFAQPETEAGVRIMSDPVQDFAPPGEPLTYSVEIFNLSESLTDTLQVSLSAADWPVELETSTLTLGPCQEGSVTLTVTVPTAVERNTTEEFTLSAVSTNAPEYATDQIFRFKTPDRLLLVDDDRWRDQGAIYADSLAGAGYTFDHWEVGHNAAGRGSPPGVLLNAYEIVVWFTAFDWFRPVTPAESESLHAYVAQGGRLFLSSQDYLYYHLRDPLTRDFLGVSSYEESLAPAQVFDADELKLLRAPTGSLQLDFASNNNFSDGVVPVAGARAAMWHDQGMAAGVANSGAVPGLTGAYWRTIFLAFPFETLPPESRTAIMSRMLGWLGDLGESSFEVDQRVSRLHPKPEARRSYTLTLRHVEGGRPGAIAITGTLPAGLELERDSLGGGASFDRGTGQFTWQGIIEPGASHAIPFRATPRPNLKDGDRLDSVVAIHDLEHGLRFEKWASLWVDAPDLAESVLALSPGNPRPGKPVTLSLQLANSSRVASQVSVTVWLPAGLEALTDTLEAGSGAADSGAADSGAVSLHERRLSWQTSVPAGEYSYLSLVLMAPRLAVDKQYMAMALIEDGVTDPLIRVARFSLAPFGTHLPYFQLDAALTR